MRLARSCSLAALAVAVAVACSNDLPVPSEIAGLRVLAISAEPAEVLLDTPGPIEVRFDALVVDPTGAAVSYTWQFCPVESDAACYDYDARRAAAPEAMQPALDELHALGAAGTAIPLPDSAGLAAEERATRGLWPHDVAPFTLSLDAAQATSLFLYHAQTNYLGSGMGSWPLATLSVSTPSDAQFSAKHFVIGVSDLAQFAGPVAETLGYVVCPGDASALEPPDCLPLRQRLPNQNPVFESLKLARGELASTPFEDLVGVPALAPGESVRILPRFTPESFEAYQDLRTDLATRKVEVSEEVEELSVSWFASSGELSEELTWPKFTKTLDTAYTAPKTAPLATQGRVTLFLVARDQRGGVAWKNVEFIVGP